VTTPRAPPRAILTDHLARLTSHATLANKDIPAKLIRLHAYQRANLNQIVLHSLLVNPHARAETRVNVTTSRAPRRAKLTIHKSAICTLIVVTRARTDTRANATLPRAHPRANRFVLHTDLASMFANQDIRVYQTKSRAVTPANRANMHQY